MQRRRKVGEGKGWSEKKVAHGYMVSSDVRANRSRSCSWTLTGTWKCAGCHQGQGNERGMGVESRKVVLRFCIRAGVLEAFLTCP